MRKKRGYGLIRKLTLSFLFTFLMGCPTDNYRGVYQRHPFYFHDGRKYKCSTYLIIYSKEKDKGEICFEILIGMEDLI